MIDLHVQITVIPNNNQSAGALRNDAASICPVKWRNLLNDTRIQVQKLTQFESICQTPSSPD